MQKAILMNSTDNVATAITDIEPGTTVSLLMGEKARKVEVKENIPFGHKFSITKIEKGESVIKYGEKIGTASQTIDVGLYVHVHNVESSRGRGDLEK